MATNRKLGRTTDIRMAMLKTLTTDLIMHGKIETTLPRAKEVKSIADSLISLAIKEKDNFETVDVKVVKAKLDAKGNKETELVKSKNGKEYLRVVKEETTEKRQKDMPSRLNARRKMMKKINKVKDSEGNNVDLTSKLFNEIAPKYAAQDENGNITQTGEPVLSRRYASASLGTFTLSYTFFIAVPIDNTLR